MSNDIYSYIESNFEIKITDYQFKRDYILNPLKRHPNTKKLLEYPYKEDIEYLYLILNLTRDKLCQIFNVNTFIWKKIVKYLNIKKDTKLIYENIKKGTLEKYGVENYTQTDDWHNKVLEKYNGKYYVETDEFKEKFIKNNLKKYGKKSYFQTNEFKERAKKINLEKYGVEFPSQSNEIKEKIKQTCLQKYNAICYAKSMDFQNKKDEIINKQYNTKISNKTIGKSIIEQKIYNLLSLKFKNIKCSFKSNLYPFPCDFYISDLDLYIEYQGYFTHGKEPYIGTNEQKEIIKKWKSKNTYQYDKAIQTWTIRDPLKRETAKKNNLNWIEFFNREQFMEWFNQLK